MYLCNKSGYLQRDWKMDNIGLIKTDDKYINIFDSKIKTHGYKVVLLDYGAIIHKKYILSSYEKNIFRNKMTDLFFMFDRYKYNMIFNFKEFENKYNVDTFDSCTIDEDINKLLPKFNKNNYLYNLIKTYVHHFLILIFQAHLFHHEYYYEKNYHNQYHIFLIILFLSYSFH